MAEPAAFNPFAGGMSPAMIRALQKYQLGQTLTTGAAKQDASSGLGVLAKILQGGLGGYLQTSAGRDAADIQQNVSDTTDQALRAGAGWKSPDPVYAGPSAEGAANSGVQYSPTNEAVVAPAGTQLIKPDMQRMYDVLRGNPNTAAKGQEMQMAAAAKRQELQYELQKALGAKGVTLDDTGQASAMPGYGPAVGSIEQMTALGKGRGSGQADIETKPLLEEALIGPAVRKAQALAPVEIGVAGGKAAAEAPYRITPIAPGGSAVSAATIAGGGGGAFPMQFGAGSANMGAPPPQAPAPMAAPPMGAPAPAPPMQGPVAAPRVPVQSAPIGTPAPQAPAAGAPSGYIDERTMQAMEKGTPDPLRPIGPIPNAAGGLPTTGGAPAPGSTGMRPGFYQDPRPAPGTQPGEIETYLGKRFVQTQEGGIDARSRITALDRMMGLLDQVNTGKFAGTTTDIKAAAKSFGFDLNALGIRDDVGPAQAAMALGNEMALQARNPAGGAGMPGAMSEGDRKFLEAMQPGITTSPEGRALMAETLRKTHQRSIDVAEFARKYARDHGGRIDLNFEDALGQHFADKPVFGKADQEMSVKVTLMGQARDAIAKGAPKDAVAKRLKEQGVDPGGL